MSRPRKITARAIHDRLDAIRRAANVSVAVVLRDAENVGTVIFKYPRGGAGRLVAMAADWTAERPEDETFSTWTRWQYGWAGGGGYDKHSAALSGMTIAGVTLKDDGLDWERQLRDAGLKVIRPL